MSATSTVAFAFKKAFYDAVVALMPTAFPTEFVDVSFGPAFPYQPDNLVEFLGVRSSQEPVTLSASNRAREETLELDVQVSVFQGGAEVAEIEVARRGYAYLGAIENYVRTTNTQLAVDGSYTVRECFLTSHQSAGATPDDGLADGRLVIIQATFTAHVRISN